MDRDFIWMKDVLSEMAGFCRSRQMNPMAQILQDAILSLECAYVSAQVEEEGDIFSGKDFREIRNDNVVNIR